MGDRERALLYGQAHGDNIGHRGHYGCRAIATIHPRRHGATGMDVACRLPSSRWQRGTPWPSAYGDIVGHLSCARNVFKPPTGYLHYRGGTGHQPAQPSANGCGNHVFMVGLTANRPPLRHSKQVCLICSTPSLPNRNAAKILINVNLTSSNLN